MRDYISNVVMTAIKEYADSLELEFCVETLGDKPIVSLFVSSPDYDEGKHFHLVDIPDELLGEDYVEDRISIKKITKFKKAWNTFLKTVEGDSNGTGA